jgi:hypothetical protein
MAKKFSVDKIDAMCERGHIAWVETHHLLCDPHPLLPRFHKTRERDPKLCLKFNYDCGAGLDLLCPLCGFVHEPPYGYALCLDGTDSPVCDSCGQKHALDLFLAMKVASDYQAVEDWIAEDGRIRAELGLPETKWDGNGDRHYLERGRSS